MLTIYYAMHGIKTHYQHTKTHITSMTQQQYNKKVTTLTQCHKHNSENTCIYKDFGVI